MERPRWRFTANYRILHKLQIGIELNPKANEIGPLLTLFFLTESEKRPAVVLGTSSDRIGSPAGKQSYYVTVSKYLPFLSTSLYSSLNYSEWDDAFNIPFGAAIELGKGFSLRPMYDGDRSHLLLDYFSNQYGISLIYVWFETLGLSFSAGL